MCATQCEPRAAWDYVCPADLLPFWTKRRNKGQVLSAAMCRRRPGSFASRALLLLLSAIFLTVARPDTLVSDFLDEQPWEGIIGGDLSFPEVREKLCGGHVSP